MLLIHTTATSLPGAPRHRTIARFDKRTGQVRRNKYVLNQPDVHSKYRGMFWAVDRYNKLALGPGSVQYATYTKKWETRLFLAFIAMSETNAYLAHCQGQDAAG